MQAQDPPEDGNRSIPVHFFNNTGCPQISAMCASALITQACLLYAERPLPPFLSLWVIAMQTRASRGDTDRFDL